MQGMGKAEKGGRGRRAALLVMSLLPLCCAFLLLLYIRHAAADVVYSDYIRLVNSYLPDTGDAAKFFVPDILTRIPLAYLARALNVALFGYSITFDRVLGVFGLLLSAYVLLTYLLERGLGLSAAVPLMLLLFSLNKWEMLLNGSGYAHFLSFALFYLGFLLLDREVSGGSGRKDAFLLCILPWLCLMTAGPYIVVYLLSLLLAYAFLWIFPPYGRKPFMARSAQGIFPASPDAGRSAGRGEKHFPARLDCLRFCAALLPLILYLLSNHYAVYEYAGAKDIGLSALFRHYPAFSLHFLLNGFASMLLGGEEIEALLGSGILSYPLVYGLGLLVLFAYAYAFFLYFQRGMYRETLFPLLMLLYGLGSHGIVFLSRYIFLNETYAWQSRYALQYQSGILGILLVFALYRRGLLEERGGGRPERGNWRFLWRSLLPALLCLCFVFGNLYTTWAELGKMEAREAHYEEMYEAAQELDVYADADLERIFEYHHGGARIRQAFGILRENDLNVYRGAS